MTFVHLENRQTEERPFPKISEKSGIIIISKCLHAACVHCSFPLCSAGLITRGVTPLQQAREEGEKFGVEKLAGGINKRQEAQGIQGKANR